MATVILQNVSSKEVRSIRMAAMLLDGLDVINSSIDDLRLHRQSLCAGAMPVGSVEFVRKALSILKIKEPLGMSYPKKAQSYLKRNIRKLKVSDLSGKCFVKPVKTKLFTGFVMGSQSEMDAHDQEQLEKMKRLARDTKVWASDVVCWKSEWRYYVANGKVVGKGRYDQGEDAAPVPRMEKVLKCIRTLDIKHPYALDMGVLDSGETALVEANDAWAIGLYQGAMSDKDYYAFLRCRWDAMLGQQQLDL